VNALQMALSKSKTADITPVTVAHMTANISAIVIRIELCEQHTIYICILYDKRDRYSNEILTLKESKIMNVYKQQKK
jgi:hypothetical protein